MYLVGMDADQIMVTIDQTLRSMFEKLRDDRSAA
jgi:hypothetical protein